MSRPGRRWIHRLAAVVLMAAFCLRPVALAAAVPLPPVNDAPRHVLCDGLSDQAKAYYAGDHAYDRLAALDGAGETTDGYAAMQDNPLFDALHALMADTHLAYTAYSGYNAGSLAYYWAATDAVNSGDTYVMFYSDVPADSPDAKLNREHIWPKSRASYNEKNGGADLHHLRPALDYLNRDKSDHAFGNVRGTYAEGVKAGLVNGEEAYWVCAKADRFECKDDVKGDVARILLYVYCRWEQPNLYTDMTDHLPAMDADDKSNSGLRAVEDLDTLLQWCAADPVDEWEMTRNDRIERVQGNRNVFIDYPALAWSLFGRKAPADMPTPSGDWIRGDINMSGAVSAEDALMALQASTGKIRFTPAQSGLGDVDGSQTVTAADALVILQLATGKIDRFFA